MYLNKEGIVISYEPQNQYVDFQYQNGNTTKIEIADNAERWHVIYTISTDNHRLTVNESHKVGEEKKEVPTSLKDAKSVNQQWTPNRGVKEQGKSIFNVKAILLSIFGLIFVTALWLLLIFFKKSNENEDEKL